jgi:hypothetical protein
MTEPTPEIKIGFVHGPAGGSIEHRALWRYLFAGLAMHVIKDEHLELSPDETALWSRKYADALLAELASGDA